MSSRFSTKRPWTTELPVLQRLKKSHRLVMGKMTSSLFAIFSAVFYPILFILAGNDDMHKSSEEFEIKPDPTTDCGVSCP